MIVLGLLNEIPWLGERSIGPEEACVSGKVIFRGLLSTSSCP